MLIDLLQRYGYVMVFGAAAIEGDATLVTATFLAHRGYFRLGLVILTAALGTVAVNNLYFWTARTHRRRLPGHAPHSRVYTRVTGWVARYGVQLVACSRFMYGFRVAIPIACGASGMSPVVFLVADTFGALLWSTVLGFAGFAIGQLLETLIDDVRRHEWWLALALFVAGLGFLAWHGRDRSGAEVLREVEGIGEGKGEGEGEKRR